MKTIIAAYCRVSTKEQEQLTSFEHQQIYFNKEFGDHASYELYRVYGDIGRSGTKLSRPQFDEMIKDAGIDKSRVENDLFVITGAPKFNRIKVRNTSRFARNVSVDMLIKTLAKNGVYVDFVDTNLSTERASDSVTLGVLQLLDQNESLDKSRKVSFGMRVGADKGNILCTNRIYGYKYLPQPDNRLEIIPEEAEVVKMMFELYLQGVGAYRISNTLTKQGIFTREGKPFAECTIRSILSNEKYCGLVTRMKYDTGVVFAKHSKKIRDKGEWIVFEDKNKMPPIISKETFDRAQEVKENRTEHKIQKGKNHGSTDYAQKIVCGCCGRQYRATCTTVRKGKRTRYYACVQKRKMVFNDNGERVFLCKNPNVSEPQLDEALNCDNYGFLLCNNILGAVMFLEKIQATLEYNIRNTDTSHMDVLKTTLTDTEGKIRRLLQLVVSGTVDDTYVNETAAPLQKQATELREQINALEKPLVQKQGDIADIQDTIVRLKKRCDEVYDLERDTAVAERTRKEILADVKHIVVDSNGGLAFIFNSFDDVYELIAKHKYVLPRDIQRDFDSMAGFGLYDELAIRYMDYDGIPKRSLEELIAEIKGARMGMPR
jgi:DNA invertase Pin-like site-specific DNA recombinase